jgi:hypothetical protein
MEVEKNILREGVFKENKRKLIRNSLDTQNIFLVHIFLGVYYYYYSYYYYYFVQNVLFGYKF